MKAVFWGTYDTGKPRNRILIKGLRENNIELFECHSHVWEGVEDKSQVKSLSAKLAFILRWLSAYPGLLWRYLRLPKHDVVIVGYLGQLDVLVIWPFAKLRGARIVWDAFLSLHDTVVYDRELTSTDGPLSCLLYCWEWLACRAADMVILDTNAHRDLFVQKFHLDENKTGAVFVGAEPDTFKEIAHEESRPGNGGLHVLFYGQFIPLHGISYIIEAARLLSQKPIFFTIIGTGQESELISRMMSDQSLDNVTFIPWVRYEKLRDLIENADICLGIFGASGKAARVIPNKVFQIIQVGKPLITRDSPAIRELLQPDMEGIFFVKPASGEAIAEMLLSLYLSPEKLRNPDRYQGIREKIQPSAIGSKMIGYLL